MERILARLVEKDPFLKLEKCKFAVQEVDFLGMVITPGHIKMDPIKLVGIADCPEPTTVKQTRSFLGFGNFCRCFIKGYTSITKPLTDLTKKGLNWEWMKKCREAFETLKEKFTMAPVL
jgi:hypothetical protein